MEKTGKRSVSKKRPKFRRDMDVSGTLPLQDPERIEHVWTAPHDVQSDVALHIFEEYPGTNADESWRQMSNSWAEFRTK